MFYLLIFLIIFLFVIKFIFEKKLVIDFASFFKRRL